MTKPKRINNIKKTTIIILIILCLSLIVILAIAKRKDNSQNTNQNESNKLVQVSNRKNYENELKFSGFGVFFDNFTGDSKSSEILSSVKTITVKYIPKLYDLIKKYNESELETFYNNNSKNIKTMFGIQNLDDFKKFAMSLQNKLTNDNVRKFIRVDVNEDTFKDESDIPGYAYVEYSVTYEDNTVVNFLLYVARDKNNEVPNMVNVV